MIGDGRRFTMEGGILMTIWDGLGCLIMNGALPGSIGGPGAVITDGHP